MELASCRAVALHPSLQTCVAISTSAAACRTVWCRPPVPAAGGRRGRRAGARAARGSGGTPRPQPPQVADRATGGSSSSNGLPSGAARGGAAPQGLHAPLDLAAAAADGGGGDPQHQGLVWTKFVAETLLPTRQGKFRLRGYRHTNDGGRTYTEPTVIMSGNPEGLADVPVRVHDACFTSEVLGSLKCDCREQLELAMTYIRDHPPGAVIYLQQEGRGIGLANKIAAYALQEKGLDTVDANRALGLPDDCREYSAVKHILEELGIQSIQLMTNNPRKLAELGGLGIPVSGRIPCLVQAQQYNAGYLDSKHKRMAHILNPDLFSSTDDPDPEPLQGQTCFWDHEGEPSSAGIPLEAPVPLPEGLDEASSALAPGSALAASSDSSPLKEPGGCGSGGSADVA